MGTKEVFIMAQYEYRLSYQDKKKELVNFIFNCINDTMMDNYGIRYRTVTREQIAQLEGNVSILEAPLYYDDKFRTLYLYYVMDKNNRWGRPVDCNKMYRDINAHIKDTIFEEEAASVEFLGACKKFDGQIHECCANVSNILSSLVFTYWTWDGLENKHNEFIMDKRYIVQEYGKNPDLLPEFNRLTEDINNRYDLKANFDDYPLAFNEYKNLFYNTFGTEIKCANDDVEHMFLLNETDYSIFE